MIEKTVLDYMNENMSVPVYMEKPSNEPTSYVLIEKTGGSRSNYLDQATIAVQSYAPSLYEAVLLDENAREVMDSLDELDSIVSARLVRNYNFTDTTKKKYRYQSIYDLVHY